MTTLPSDSKLTSRLTLLDALRGFALLGVILIHIQQQFYINSFSPDKLHSLFPSIDPVIKWIGDNLISGRFINIFAFLFGVSFFIQMDRAAKKGVDFRWRFIWRMVIMFLIGLIGLLFYTWEIITLYAALGCVLVLFSRAKTWVLLVLATLLALGTPRAVYLFCTVEKEEIVEIKQVDAKPIIANSKPIGPDRSSFLQSAKFNFKQGVSQKLKHQFGEEGRGYITFSLFLFGLVVGRNRFFEKVQSNRKVAFLFALFVIFTAVMTYFANIFEVYKMNFQATYLADAVSVDFFLLTFNNLSVLLFSACLVLGFMLLYQQSWGKLLDVFSPYGRMSLTNYEAQSVIGCLIFSMWAFGRYFESWGTTELFLLGIGIYIFQLISSYIWMKYFLYGPLEWLLRTATYLKVQPFRKP